MHRYYFTFGSDPRFPYGRGDYVIVYAPTAHVAGKKFQNIHPNRPDSPFLNCSDIYSEESWRKFCRQYYEGVNPVEVIN